MKLFLRIILVSIFAVFLAGNAMALPFPFKDGGAGLQKVLDDITVTPAGGSSIDVTQDYVVNDEYWSITGSGQSAATLIIELAGFADKNIFGIYSDGKYVPIFNGVDGAGKKAVVSILLDGSVEVNFNDTGIDFAGNNFGYYLDSSANAASGGALFHSDTSLNEIVNGEHVDHMVAYQGNDSDVIQLPNLQPGVWTDNEFILAFEDLLAPGGDYEFTDFVVMVESVKPIPEPATMFLLGLGLVGLAGVTRKKTA